MLVKSLVAELGMNQVQIMEQRFCICSNMLPFEYTENNWPFTLYVKEDRREILSFLLKKTVF